VPRFWSVKDPLPHSIRNGDCLPCISDTAFAVVAEPLIASVVESHYQIPWESIPQWIRKRLEREAVGFDGQDGEAILWHVVGTCAGRRFDKHGRPITDPWLYLLVTLPILLKDF